jgi:hypothetical protein
MTMAAVTYKGKHDPMPAPLTWFSNEPSGDYKRNDGAICGWREHLGPDGAMHRFFVAITGDGEVVGDLLDRADPKGLGGEWGESDYRAWAQMCLDAFARVGGVHLQTGFRLAHLSHGDVRATPL